MSEYDLNDIPTEYQVRSKIDLFKPLFLEAYRRSKAYSMFPHAEMLMKSNDEAAGMSAFGELFGGYGHITQSPTGKQFVAPYRWSDTLEIYMPADIAADDPQRDIPGTVEHWVGSSAADDGAIESYASGNVDSDIASIKDAFQPVFDECDIRSVRALLNRVNGAAEALTELIDAHKGKEFAEVAELFEEWEGEDAYHCYEVFGQRLRPAAGNQRQMLAALVRSASEEGKAQGTAFCQLHNAVAAGHLRIEESINAPDYVAEATRRFTGTVLVNRVKFLSDVLATVDFAFEITSEGEEQGKTGGIISRIMEWAFPDYANVPTVELCNGVRDALVEAGETEKEDLYDARQSFREELENAEEDWHSEIKCSIIPGYVER